MMKSSTCMKHGGVFLLVISIILVTASHVQAAPAGSTVAGLPSFSFWRMLGAFLLGLLIFPVLELVYNVLMGFFFLPKSQETWKGWKVIGYIFGIMLFVMPDSPFGGGIFSWHVAHTVAFLVGAGIATICLIALRMAKKTAKPSPPPLPPDP